VEERIESRTSWGQAVHDESIRKHLYPWCAIVDTCSVSAQYCCAPSMTNYTTLEALVRTWSPHFVPFLGEEQWEPYHGEEGSNKACLLSHGNGLSEIETLKKIKG
jgi:hypothetical protein